jgi:glycosyltransferase involved in cell wall biosynthesis
MTTNQSEPSPTAQITESLSPSPMLALLPWGDLIEDFLDEIGVSLEDFSSKMTGGWLFGYVDALRLRGIRTCIFCFSDRVEGTVHTVHQATGAEFVLIRTPATYRSVRRRTKDPYGLTVEAMFGPTRGLSRQVWRLAHHVVPYLATPVMTLAREIQRAGCCAILCQEYESPRFDASVAVGKLLRIPVFATFQGGSWHRSGIERRLRPLTLRHCAGLIIGSSVEAARVRERYRIPSEKISRIFNPLDLSEWRPSPRRDARRKLGIPDTTRVAIWHGRIDILTKGLDVLLEAWKFVCSQRSERDILLILVGSGNGADMLDEQIHQSAVPHIRWIRDYVLDRVQIRQYLSAADVYVFPSRREGFPVAPLEAMACGLPTVAASAPGIADIFDEGEKSGGLVVPVGDVTSLVRNLGLLLDDDEAARILGMRARERVERAFSLQTVGAQLQEFFGERAALKVSACPPIRR